MRMPGFTAEDSLYQTSGSYRMTATDASASQVLQILPQQGYAEQPWVRRCFRRCDPFGGWCETECHTLYW